MFVRGRILKNIKMLSRRQVLNLKWRATFVALAILGLFYFGPSLPAGKCSARSRIGRSLLNTDEGQDTASCEDKEPNCVFQEENIAEDKKAEKRAEKRVKQEQLVLLKGH